MEKERAVPLVTDTFFDALLRKSLWRLVCVLGAGLLIPTLPMYPTYSRNGIPTLIYLLWTISGVLIVLGSWRWYYWHQIMKANIFNDDPPQL